MGLNYFNLIAMLFQPSTTDFLTVQEIVSYIQHFENLREVKSEITADKVIAIMESQNYPRLFRKIDDTCYEGYQASLTFLKNYLKINKTI